MSEDYSMIHIDGQKIGLYGLSKIIEEVKSLGLSNDGKIARLLIDKLKAENFVPEIKEDIYARVILREYKKSLGMNVEPGENCKEQIIRILGPGCAACDKLMQDTLALLVELDIAADVQHVRDLNEISRYGLISTPALVLNNKIAVSGRTLSQAQLKKILESEIKK